MSRLNTLLRYYQSLLRLTDWIIEAKYAPQRDLMDESTPLGGNIVWSAATKEATISILRPEDREGLEEFDEEGTLAHELLHLRWDGHKDYEPPSHPAVYAATEFAINSISAALVAQRVALGDEETVGTVDACDSTTSEESCCTS